MRKMITKEVECCDNCGEPEPIFKCEFCGQSRCGTRKCKIEHFLPGGFYNMGVYLCQKCKKKYKNLVKMYREHQGLKRKILKEIDRIKGEKP